LRGRPRKLVCGKKSISCFHSIGVTSVGYVWVGVLIPPTYPNPFQNTLLEITVPLPAAKLPKKVPVQIEGEERQASAS